MSRKTIIFDFDGTIADTFKLVIEIINKTPREFGVDSIDPQEIPRLRNLSVEYLLKEFNVHIFQVPWFLLKMKKRLKPLIKTANLFPGIKEMLFDLKNKNFQLILFSKNSYKNIR